MQPERLPPLPEEERRLRKKNNLPAFLLAGVVIGLLGFGMNRLMTPPRQQWRRKYSGCGRPCYY
jgi:hypothetical protein